MLNPLLAPKMALQNSPRPFSRQPLDLEPLPAAERIAEIAEILAAGLVRHSARMSSQKSPNFGESSLDIPGGESGHPTPTDRRMADV